jgi:hypothetical protein
MSRNNQALELWENNVSRLEEQSAVFLQFFFEVFAPLRLGRSLLDGREILSFLSGFFAVPVFALPRSAFVGACSFAFDRNM